MTMNEDEDPAREALAKVGRTTLMAAGVTAEQVARHWRMAKERGRHASTAEARRLQARYDTERRAARAALAAADERWARAADLEELARTWAIAHTWAELEREEFGPQAEQLRATVERERGLDPAVLRTESPPDSGLSATRTPRDRGDEAAAVTVAAGVAIDAAQDHDQAAHDASTTTPDADQEQVQGLSSESDRPASQLMERAIATGVDPDVARGRRLAANAEAHPVEAAGRGVQPQGVTARKHPGRAPRAEREVKR